MADGRRRRLFIWGALGLLAWFVVEFIGVGIAGAGHGWVAPFFFTLPLLLLYPAAFIRAFAVEPRTVKVELAMLVIAAVLDMLLSRNMLGSEHEYFLKVWNYHYDGEHAILLLWFGLWAAWQVLTLVTLLRIWSPRGTPQV